MAGRLLESGKCFG